jgi:hypothetical protein
MIVTPVMTVTFLDPRICVTAYRNQATIKTRLHMSFPGPVRVETRCVRGGAGVRLGRVRRHENGQFQADCTPLLASCSRCARRSAKPYVIDSFDHSAGAVTFVDEQGGLYGVICTPNFDVLAGR